MEQELDKGESIFLVPMARKRYAQFKFVPAHRMEELLTEYNIPYQKNKIGFTGVRLIPAHSNKDLKSYKVKKNTSDGKESYYTFLFKSDVIEDILKYYNVDYIVNYTSSTTDFIKKETNKDMNYRIKQAKAKLDNWYICHKLGIKYGVWVDVKTGKRNLAKDKLDQFLELVDPKRQEYIVQESEKQVIDEWYKENRDKISDKMAEFNVTGRVIGSDLGVNSSNISIIKNKGPENSQVAYLLYYYFQDENNKRNISGKRKRAGRKPKEAKQKYCVPESILEYANNVSATNSELSKSVEESSRVLEYLVNGEKKDEAERETAEKIVNILTTEDNSIPEDYCHNDTEQTRIAALEQENKRLLEELSRYRYLIDLAMTK